MNNLRFSPRFFPRALLLTLLFAGTAHAQNLDERTNPTQKATTNAPTWLELSPPLEQTVDGVRVRLRAICWCRANQLDIPDEQYLEQDDALGLAVRYEVRGDAKTDGKMGTLTQAKIYGSSGAPNSALSPQSNIAPQGNGGVLFWTGANPRWKKAQLDLEWRGANQGENAQGKFSAPVEFEVPVPNQTDVAQAATGQWKSVHGTQYLMRQTMVATKPFKSATATFEWQPGFYFSIQQKYPPSVPGSDAFPDINEDQPEIIAVGANGEQTELKAEFGSGWTLTDVFASKKNGIFDQGVRSNYTKPLPPGTKSVLIRFVARESSDAWRDENALQKFHFPLDLSRVPLPPVDAAWRPIATARGQRLEVALDNWRDFGKGFTARLMTRDVSHPDDARRLWLLRGTGFMFWSDFNPVEARVLGHEDWKATAGFRGVYKMPGLSQSWWRPNAEPIVGSSNERDVTFTKPSSDTADTKAMTPPFAIEGTWDEWLAVEHDWTLDDLPIPQPGQSIVVNRELQGDGARLVLRKLTAFDAEHPVPGTDAEFLAERGHLDGIEATFEVVQTALPNARLDLDTFEPKQGNQIVKMRDDRGRELRNFAHDGNKHPQWTATFTLPARDAKTLSLHLTLTESALTGASETLTLRDLPQPTIPPQGTY